MLVNDSTLLHKSNEQFKAVKTRRETSILPFSAYCHHRLAGAFPLGSLCKCCIMSRLVEWCVNTLGKSIKPRRKLPAQEKHNNEESHRQLVQGPALVSNLLHLLHLVIMIEKSITPDCEYGAPLQRR